MADITGNGTLITAEESCKRFAVAGYLMNSFMADVVDNYLTQKQIDKIFEEVEQVCRDAGDDADDHPTFDELVRIGTPDQMPVLFTEVQLNWILSVLDDRLELNESVRGTMDPSDLPELDQDTKSTNEIIGMIFEQTNVSTKE